MSLHIKQLFGVLGLAATGWVGGGCTRLSARNRCDHRGCQRTRREQVLGRQRTGCCSAPLLLSFFTLNDYAPAALVQCRGRAGWVRPSCGDMLCVHMHACRRVDACALCPAWLLPVDLDYSREGCGVLLSRPSAAVHLLLGPLFDYTTHEACAVCVRVVCQGCFCPVCALAPEAGAAGWVREGARICGHSPCNQCLCGGC